MSASGLNRARQPMSLPPLQVVIAAAKHCAGANGHCRHTALRMVRPCSPRELVTPYGRPPISKSG